MSVDKGHGPDMVGYMNGPCGPEPFLGCLCGWSTTASTWEDVGQDFDSHLEQEARAPTSEGWDND